MCVIIWTMPEKSAQSATRPAPLSDTIEGLLGPLLDEIPGAKAAYGAPIPNESQPIIRPDLCVSVYDPMRRREILLLIKGSMGECLLIEARTPTPDAKPIAVGVFNAEPDHHSKLACALCSVRTLPRALESFVETLKDSQHKLNAEAPLGVAIFQK